MIPSTKKTNPGDRPRARFCINGIARLINNDTTNITPYDISVIKACILPKLNVESAYVIKNIFRDPSKAPKALPRPPAKFAPPSTRAVTAIKV